MKYYLSPLPAETPLNDLVALAQRRWRVFHHHAALTIAAYGLLVSKHLNVSGASKKLPLPPDPCGSREAVRRVQRHVADSLATLRHELSVRLLRRLTRCPCCGRSDAKLSS